MSTHLAYTPPSEPTSKPTNIPTAAALRGREAQARKAADRAAKTAHLEGGWTVAPDVAPGIGWVLTEPKTRRRRYYSTEVEAHAAFGYYAKGIPAPWVGGIKPHGGTQGMPRGEIVDFPGGPTGLAAVPA